MWFRSIHHVLYVETFMGNFSTWLNCFESVELSPIRTICSWAIMLIVVLILLIFRIGMITIDWMSSFALFSQGALSWAHFLASRESRKSFLIYVVSTCYDILVLDSGSISSVPSIIMMIVFGMILWRHVIVYLSVLLLIKQFLQFMLGLVHFWRKSRRLMLSTVSRRYHWYPCPLYHDLP